MPSTLNVNGAVIATPGVYTSVDSSGLDITGLSASGVLGVIGTAVGGTPYTALDSVDDIVTITNPSQGLRQYQSGDLLEAIGIAFNPSNDASVKGGAQAVLALQVNPATQAILTEDSGHVTFTADAYGSLGNAVSVQISSGTTSGQRITITNGTTTEIGDNLDNADATAVVAWVNANSKLVTATYTQQAANNTQYGAFLTPTNTAVAQGDTYSVKINGTTFSHTVSASDSIVTVLQALTAAINGGSLGLQATFQQPTPGVVAYRIYVVQPSGAPITVLPVNNMAFTENDITVAGPALVNPPALPTGAAQSLAGGSDGQATFQDWLNCLNLFKQVRVNSVIVLTTDASVHAALAAHCAYMCGAGQSERDGWVGIAASATQLPSRTDILSALNALNDPNIRACAGGITRYNNAGVLTQFPTYFEALLGAGMQAGSSPGQSLTRKTTNCLAVARDKSWNLADNREEMILAGLLFQENKPNVGRRWVRNVTTWTTDNNAAYSDGGVRNAVNYAVYNLREAVDFAIGRENFAGTNNAIVAVAGKYLQQLIAENVITAYRALGVTPDPDEGDALLLTVQIAPTQTINFINFTISLATPTQIAAAA